MPGNLNPEDWEALSQDLAEAEVENYLAWQFSDLAKRPCALKLKETASVVRYMLWLSSHGIPREIVSQGTEAIQKYQRGDRTPAENHLRQDVEKTAKIIWGDLLSFGEFETGSKPEAQSFFEKHASDWHHPWLQPSLQFLKEFDLPPGAEPPFRQQSLVGRYVSAQGDGNPYLEDDLSERIAAAEYALIRAGIQGRRALIAKALSESPLTAKAKDTWGAEEVRNRVRTYERLKNHQKEAFLADSSVFFYRWAVYVKEHQPGSQPESEGDAVS